jgi:hypothetical protein
VQAAAEAWLAADEAAAAAAVAAAAAAAGGAAAGGDDAQGQSNRRKQRREPRPWQDLGTEVGNSFRCTALHVGLSKGAAHVSVARDCCAPSVPQLATGLPGQ